MSVVKIISKVKEQRRGVGQAVNAIEDATMPRQHAAAVLEADVTFQSRDRHVADESGVADQQAGRYRNHPSHRRKPFCEQYRKQCGRRHAAEKTFPGLVWT